MSESHKPRLWTIAEIRKLFSMEFGFIEDRFKFIQAIPKEWKATEDDAARPGVYVYWKDNRVIKVGRSFSNARKRASEHMSDNTGKTMADLKDDPEARLLLFTVDLEESHWVAALEVFFEEWLNPSIRSKRKG